MPLINRIARLCKADLHAVLDRIEEPELVLRQAIRDMEEAAAAARRRLASLHRERGRLTLRLEELRAAAGAAEEELSACFDRGREDLARSLIRRRLELERLGAALTRRRTRIEEEAAALQRRGDENGARLESMRQRAELLGAGPEEHDETACTDEVTVREEDVEIAFLREKSRRQSS